MWTEISESSSEKFLTIVLVIVKVKRFENTAHKTASDGDRQNPFHSIAIAKDLQKLF